MSWIVVPHWQKFQHYHDRQPTWIKLYLDLKSRDEWTQLSLSARGLLVSIWIEYAASRGILRVTDLPSRVTQKIDRRTFDSLLRAGFIKVRSSKPLAHPLALARTRERGRERPPKSPKSTEGRKVTGWRLVRGTHGVTHVPDPFGVDVPPADAKPLKGA